jgi:hypothetical protein
LQTSKKDPNDPLDFFRTLEESFSPPSKQVEDRLFFKQFALDENRPSARFIEPVKESAGVPLELPEQEGRKSPEVPHPTPESTEEVEI